MECKKSACHHDILEFQKMRKVEAMKKKAEKLVNKPVDCSNAVKGTKTMMKDKIKIQRDVAIANINGSKYLSADDKMYLVELISEAAEGTNGLEPKDKLQNVSETTFNLAILMSRVDDKINTLPELTQTMQTMATQLSQLKKPDVPDTWTGVAKALLLKPWIYIALAAIGIFSPYCADMIKACMSFFN